jgi:predicted DNA-binding ribbon-helix-helix protein
MEQLSRSERSRVFKRSIVIDGRKTSVSLENEFWDGLREIANREKTNLAKLVGRIDHERMNINLSSTIRVFVLNYFQSRDTSPVITSLNGSKRSARAYETNPILILPEPSHFQTDK